MHKLLISLPFAATLVLGGCGLSEGDFVTRTLDTLPLIYRPEVQQGNLVTPEMVAQLKVGQDQSQVRYLLGTPMLQDVFHANRWDYVYTHGIGSRPSEIRRVTLLFEDGRLAQIDTDLPPATAEQVAKKKKEVVLSVPDYEDDTTIFGKLLRGAGLSEGD